MYTTSLALLAALVSFTHADIEFTSPAPGADIAGGTAISIAWKESGRTPPLTGFTTYSLYLWAGGNDDSSNAQLSAIVENVAFAQTGNLAQGVIPVGVGGSVDNAYFLKIVARGSSGILTNTSPRFSLTGMTGTFAPAILAGARAVTNTDGPPRKYEQQQAANPAATGDPFAIPFQEQEGLIRYAPMMKVPPTKITKTDLAPLYPTSSVVIATTFLPIPTITQTVTKSQTFSVSSRENTAAPVANPTDDMARFLNRWKD